MLRQFFILTFSALAVTTASAQSISYYCLRSSVEPQSVYVIGASETWKHAVKVTAYERMITQANLAEVSRAVFNLHNEPNAQILNKQISPEGYTIEPIEILAAGKSKTNYPYTLRLGLNNAMEVYTNPSDEKEFPRLVFEINSAYFRSDSNKVYKVKGLAAAITEADETKTRGLTQQFCGVHNDD